MTSLTQLALDCELEDGTESICAAPDCTGLIVVDDGIWFHARIDDLSHEARPARCKECDAALGADGQCLKEASRD